ncbi:MAG: hypothetical protein AB7S26_39365 [Sandaracinaceae bacterium]
MRRGDFRRALLAEPPLARDGWVDRALGVTELSDDGGGLPRDGVPYLPAPVDALLRFADAASLATHDRVIDVGGGVGRAAAVLHLVTGARVDAIEIQPALARAARELVERNDLGERVTIHEGDAPAMRELLASGSAFFLYCPFGPARVAATLDAIEAAARARAVRIGALDVVLPARSWLARDEERWPDLAIHRSRSSAFRTAG